MGFGSQRPALEQCPVHDRPRGDCRRLGYELEGKCQPMDETLTPVEASALQLMVVHQANLKAGFTENQSMFLLGCTMGAPIVPVTGDDPPV